MYKILRTKANFDIKDQNAIKSNCYLTESNY